MIRPGRACFRASAFRRLNSSRVLVLAVALILPWVQVAAEVFSFSADSMSGGFGTGKESAVLVGRARVVSGTLDIRADRIELSGPDWRYARCTGRVVAEDKERGIRFLTENLFHDRVAKISRMEGPSTLEDRRNKLVVKGSWIENDDRTEIALVRIAARILREDLACRAEFARYDRGAQELELTGSPSVVRDGDEYRASRILVNVETEEIRMEGSVSGVVRSAEVEGDAQSGSASPSRGEAPAKVLEGTE